MASCERAFHLVEDWVVRLINRVPPVHIAWRQNVLNNICFHTAVVLVLLQQAGMQRVPQHASVKRHTSQRLLNLPQPHVYTAELSWQTDSA